MGGSTTRVIQPITIPTILHAAIFYRNWTLTAQTFQWTRLKLSCIYKASKSYYETLFSALYYTMYFFSTCAHAVLKKNPAKRHLVPQEGSVLQVIAHILSELHVWLDPKLVEC